MNFTHSQPVRLGVVLSHPIQYYSPLLRELAKRPEVDLTVCYAHHPTPQQQGSGFGVAFEWDRDLLEGYRSLWLKNISRRPDVDQFAGLNTPEIMKRIGRREFDVVWVQGWNRLCYWQTIFACWIHRIPILVRSDSHLRTGRRTWKDSIKDLLYPLFIRRFNACMAVGEWSEEYFRHFQARKITKVAHCVDNVWLEERSAAAQLHRAQLRSNWGIPHQAIVFVFVGKLCKQKNVTLFLTALGLLKDLVTTPVWAVIVGDGPLRSECERIAQEKSLPVRFAGFVNQGRIPDCYAISDVLVMPSCAPETWGMVVNEAMACGLPVIVSDAVGCGPDLVVEGKTGLFFPSGDVDALANAMKKLVDSPEVRKQMGDAARQHIQGWCVSAVADALIETLKAMF